MSFPYVSDIVNAVLGTGLWMPIPMFGLLLVCAILVSTQVARKGIELGTTIPAPGVYPTPIYEFAAALFLFAVLWILRSFSRRPGNLFFVYVLLAGFERLLIEKIRVNVEHEIFGYYLTQAEVISFVIIVAGLVGVLVTLDTRAIWAKALISLGVLSALSACVPL